MQGRASYTWFVDPLDGTTNYAHRVPHFCVTLGGGGAGGGRARAAGRRRLRPAARRAASRAARGEGATLNGRPLAVSRRRGARGGAALHRLPLRRARAARGAAGAASARLVRQAQGMRRMGSAALDLAYVAAGRFDGYFEFGLKPWDTAAGALLVREAGGRDDPHRRRALRAVRAATCWRRTRRSAPGCAATCRVLRSTGTSDCAEPLGVPDAARLEEALGHEDDVARQHGEVLLAAVDDVLHLAPACLTSWPSTTRVTLTLFFGRGADASRRPALMAWMMVMPSS